MVQSPSVKQVRIDSGFWGVYRGLVREVVLPYQYEALNDRVEGADKSYAIHNLKAAAGLIPPEQKGPVFQDSDLGKWLEAVGYALQDKPNPQLEAWADELIGIMEKAQQPDGYLNSFYILRGLDQRFTNLIDCHELYCLGHLIEGAISYWQATGKTKVLDIMRRYADLVDRLMGPGEGQLRGYPGHEEIELALVKLYRVTGERRYLDLAEYFILERGKSPSFFIQEWEKRGRTRHFDTHDTRVPELSYFQAHEPVTGMSEAVGHAVRAVYLYSGMADIAAETGNEELRAACLRLFDNISQKQMYITGGIGQTHHGEAFTFGYDLPNDTVYAETCAAIGLVFFCRRMFNLERDAKYIDVMERALYNGVIAGMALDGRRYFYVNPLENWPEASEKNPGRNHVRPVRQPWFGCSCCPPNLARLVSGLGEYLYSYGENSIYVHLYTGSRAEFDLSCGKVTIEQSTKYPWDGAVKLTVRGAGRYTLALRVPGWCRQAALTVNGQAAEPTAVKGYILLNRDWAGQTEILLTLDMPVAVMQASPLVRADAGKVAVQRGPLVYCAEEADNGSDLAALSLPPGAGFALGKAAGLPEEAVALRVSGHRETPGDGLYYPASFEKKPAEITFVPYYLWGNRGPDKSAGGEMAVWLNRDRD